MRCSWLFHDWTRWKQQRAIRHWVERSEEITVQVRTCQRCGLTEAVDL